MRDLWTAFFLFSVSASWKKTKLYGHTEWVETKNLMAGNFDSHLRIKDMASPCLYRKPCICNNICPPIQLTQ